MQIRGKRNRRVGMGNSLYSRGGYGCVFLSLSSNAAFHGILTIDDNNTLKRTFPVQRTAMLDKFRISKEHTYTQGIIFCGSRGSGRFIVNPSLLCTHRKTGRWTMASPVHVSTDMVSLCGMVLSNKFRRIRTCWWYDSCFLSRIVME
jgi:hypothetical protein